MSSVQEAAAPKPLSLIPFPSSFIIIMTTANNNNVNAPPSPTTFSPPLKNNKMDVGQHPQQHEHDVEDGIHLVAHSGQPPSPGSWLPSHDNDNHHHDDDDDDGFSDPFDIANTKTASLESLKRWRVPSLFTLLFFTRLLFPFSFPPPPPLFFIAHANDDLILGYFFSLTSCISCICVI